MSAIRFLSSYTAALYYTINHVGTTEKVNNRGNGTTFRVVDIQILGEKYYKPCGNHRKGKQVKQQHNNQSC